MLADLISAGGADYQSSPASGDPRPQPGKT